MWDKLPKTVKSSASEFSLIFDLNAHSKLYIDQVDYEPGNFKIGFCQ